MKDLKEFKKIVKEVKPDIVYLHSSKAGALGRLAVNGNKIKMFYNPHGFSFLKQKSIGIAVRLYQILI